jgi:hypothetical protein
MRKKMNSLKKYALTETATLHLQDPDGELMYLDDDMKMPVVLELYGIGSKQYQLAERKRQDSLASKFKRYKNKTIPTEELEDLRVDFLVRVVAGCENFNLDGQTGEELYRTVFSDRSLVFITDQVDRFISDQANFTGKSLTN